jgi:hypothetical protein
MMFQDGTDRRLELLCKYQSSAGEPTLTVVSLFLRRLRAATAVRDRLTASAKRKLEYPRTRWPLARNRIIACSSGRRPLPASFIAYRGHSASVIRRASQFTVRMCQILRTGRVIIRYKIGDIALVVSFANSRLTMLLPCAPFPR